MNLSGSFESLERGTVTLLGIPFDEHSSFLAGAALAPRRIREVLHSGETNLSAELGPDLGQEPRLADLGDLPLEQGDAALGQIEGAIAALLEQGLRVLSLGGDHALTLPVLRAYARKYEALNLLHLDAHPDLYDEFEGDRYSHACPFARVMEEGLVAQLVQVGIRTMNDHQRAQAKRWGVTVVSMDQWDPAFQVHLDGPTYVSLDLDVLDPAFAPGVSHHEPGGLSTREVLRLLHGLQAPIVGADLVEFNPERDLVDMTAMVAAKFVKEIVACMLKPAGRESVEER